MSMFSFKSFIISITAALKFLSDYSHFWIILGSVSIDFFFFLLLLGKGLCFPDSSYEILICTLDIENMLQRL